MDPATARNEILPKYITAKAHCMEKTISGYLTDIGLFYTNANLPDPRRGNAVIAGMLKNIKRFHRAKLANQKDPITIQHLTAICKRLNPNDPIDAAFGFALTVGFFGMLRKSNIVPDKWDPIYLPHRPTKPITAEHVYRKNDTLYINITETKTRHDGGFSMVIPLIANGTAACPLRWYKAHTRLSPYNNASRSAFAFRQRGRGYSDMKYDRRGNRHSPPKQPFKTNRDRFVKLIKTNMRAIGCNPAKYSSHSLRHGAVTMLRERDTHPDAIMSMGDYATEAWPNYNHIKLTRRLQAAQTFADALATL